MKYPCIQIILCVFLFSSCSNNQKDYYSDGSIKSIIKLNKNGKYNGQAKFYYNNGQIEKIIDYENGDIKFCKVYYQSGELMWECPYLGLCKNGEYIEYYKNKTIKKVKLYKKDTLLKFTHYDSTNKVIFDWVKLDSIDIPKFDSSFIKLLNEQISTNKFVKIKLEIPSIPSTQLIPAIVNTEAKVIDRVNGIWEVRKLIDSKPIILGLRVSLNDSIFYLIHPQPECRKPE